MKWEVASLALPGECKVWWSCGETRIWRSLNEEAWSPFQAIKLFSHDWESNQFGYKGINQVSLPLLYVFKHENYPSPKANLILSNCKIKGEFPSLGRDSTPPEVNSYFEVEHLNQFTTVSLLVHSKRGVRCVKGDLVLGLSFSSCRLLLFFCTIGKGHGFWPECTNLRPWWVSAQFP
jgi:hypothetical protein